MSALTKDTKDYLIARLQGTAMRHIEVAERELLNARNVINEVANLLAKSMKKADAQEPV